MQLEKELEKIVENSFEDQSMFLVDILISKTKGPKKIKILIDSDKGLNIDTCALVSRVVGEEIETKSILPGAYVLEVSSPGLDYPLTMKRQYVKNVGRNLKILLVDGKEKKGRLESVNNESIIVEQQGKSKKIENQKIEINFAEIQKSIVLVSFK